MPVIDLHDEPFSSSTITKLEIFQEYLEAWLPVWARTPNCRVVTICDFFTGPGTDVNGVLGSPLRILSTINKHRALFTGSNLKAVLQFNEYDKSKFEAMRSKVLAAISELKLELFIQPVFHNCKFEDLFPNMKELLSKTPTLIFIDQNGVKQITSQVFNDLCGLSKTDFLFFVSSNYFKRFAEEPSFSCILPSLDKNRIKSAKPYHVHAMLVDAYKQMIPAGSNMRLYQFTLKKEANYYGLVFGAKHPLAVDKYLEIAWKKNSTTGDADFDLDEVAGTAQIDLFNGVKRTKLEQFGRDLEQFIVTNGEVTNKAVYDFCIEGGFRGSHGKDVLLRLKKEGKVTFPSKQPMITYDKCYREKRIVTISKTKGK